LGNCKVKKKLLHIFFWVIPRCLNSDAGELPRRKHTTYRTRQKLEIKNTRKKLFLWAFGWDHTKCL